MAATYVIGKNNRVLQNQTTCTATFASSVPVGDLIWVAVFWLDTAGGASQTMTVTGGTGNTYSSGTKHTHSNSLSAVQTFRVINQTAGAHTITATASAQVGTRIGIAIASATGVHATNAPVHNWAQGTSVSALNVGDLTSVAEGSLEFSAIFTVGDRTYTSGVPSNHTGNDTASSLGWSSYRNISPIATYGATWSWTGGNATCLGVHEIFEPTAAAGPTTPTYYQRFSRSPMSGR